MYSISFLFFLIDTLFYQVTVGNPRPVPSSNESLGKEEEDNNENELVQVSLPRFWFWI